MKDISSLIKSAILPDDAPRRQETGIRKNFISRHYTNLQSPPLSSYVTATLWIEFIHIPSGESRSTVNEIVFVRRIIAIIISVTKHGKTPIPCRDGTAFSVFKRGIYTPLRSIILLWRNLRDNRSQKSDQIGRQPGPFSSTRANARSYVNISSTRHGRVFSAGAPDALNHRRFSPSVVPRHSREQILEDPFRTRSATHKGPGLSYARYYTLYTISFQLTSPTPTFADEEIRVAIRLGTVYPTPTHCSRNHRQRETSTESRRKPRDFLV